MKVSASLSMKSSRGIARSLPSVACAFVLAVAATWATSAFAQGAAQSAPARIKVAVFDMELQDYTAGGPIAGESPLETARLKLVTSRVRAQLADSDRYEVVDVSEDNPNISAVDRDAMHKHWLWHCNGCEADIAKALGADRSLLGVFNKVSVMEQSLVFQMRDAKSGADLGRVGTDLRNETDASWTRAADFVVKDRLLANASRN